MDRHTYDLNYWKVNEAGEMTLVLTISPLIYYEETQTFNVILTADQAKDISDAYNPSPPTEGLYDDLDAII